MNVVNEILNCVTKFYLESGRFNGLPIRSLRIGKQAVIDSLEKLIRDEMVSVVYGDYHPNPYIRAMTDEPKDSQISKLKTDQFEQGCIYPLNKHLKEVVDQSVYHGRPFTLELALGEPQLAFRFFDLSVLEIYRNDPRYFYQCDDVNGYISVANEYYESAEMEKKDQVLLETFGFGYDKSLKRRVVTSLLWYLSQLSPEHQVIWKAKELRGDYFPHDDYYRNNILGDFGKRIIIFEAFLIELRAINDACKAIGYSKLFKEDFSSGRPREFGFLLRPTLKEYMAFSHLLDKMLSENINKDFFIGIKLKDENGRDKGSITLLSEWVEKNFIPKDEKSKQLQLEAISILKEIRKLRSKPGHSIIEDQFDYDLFEQQRDLIKTAYKALRVIRTMLQCHPAAKNVDVHELVQEGMIWDH